MAMTQNHGTEAKPMSEATVRNKHTLYPNRDTMLERGLYIIVQTSFAGWDYKPLSLHCIEINYLQI